MMPTEKVRLPTSPDRSLPSLYPNSPSLRGMPAVRLEGRLLRRAVPFFLLCDYFQKFYTIKPGLSTAQFDH